MPIVYSTQEDVWPRRSEYHLVTYAEEGFSPLNIFAEALGIRKVELAAFANRVNRENVPSSLFPNAPISAIPRSLIRGHIDPDELEKHFGYFMNTILPPIGTVKLIFDFRTPEVNQLVIAAIDSAIANCSDYWTGEVIVIVDYSTKLKHN